MQGDFVGVWNVSDIMCEKKSKLISRTNNGLEHHNCYFNGIIPTNHPNLVTFIHVLCEEANHVIQMMEDIDKGPENVTDNDDPVFPNIPDEFWDKTEAHKNEASKFQGRRGEGREKERLVLNLAHRIGTLCR
jgi:hypothetical protein